VCEDVGWIVEEDNDMIALARGISNYNFYNSPMAIPKGCISEIKELRVK